MQLLQLLDIYSLPNSFISLKTSFNCCFGGSIVRIKNKWSGWCFSTVFLQLDFLSLIYNIYISRREPLLKPMVVSAALVTAVLKLTHFFPRSSLYCKAWNLIDNVMQKLRAIESSFNFLISNGFAGGFFVIFFNFMQTYPPSNEWSLPQFAPRKTRTSCIDDRHLLLIQM